MKKNVSRGQTAVEYFILLAIVTALVLVAFRTLLPEAREDSEGFFNAVFNGIAGPPPIDRIQGPYP